MKNPIEIFFKLKEHKTNIKTEFIAGLTTFLTMAYIIFVNPEILSKTGMDRGAVFTATIIASIIATLIMGLVANLPFALAPGMGLNAFFTFTVVMTMGLTWQQALAIVFICGIINIILSITRIRKLLIISVPEFLQYSISGGIGLFIAYIGFKEAHFFNFLTEGYNVISSNIQDGKIINIISKDILPSLVKFNDPVTLIALFGVILIVILMILKVKGAILIGIIASSIAGIFFHITKIPQMNPKDFMPPSLAPTLFKLDFAGLFSDPAKITEILAVILAFSLSDIFDTVGTFLGTGKSTGIIDDKEMEALKNGKGFSSKTDKAIFSDSIATSIGALLGTSNVTTYIESASGITSGGKTGLTSVFVGFFFMLSIFFSPIALSIPQVATAPALIIVGILMMNGLSKINWDNMEDAIPAFFTVVIMPFSYSISNGIAAGFTFYIITKIFNKKWKEIHPLLYVVTALFISNFIFEIILK